MIPTIHGRSIIPLILRRLNIVPGVIVLLHPIPVINFRLPPAGVIIFLQRALSCSKLCKALSGCNGLTKISPLLRCGRGGSWIIALRFLLSTLRV